MLHVAGLVPFTTIDFPGKLAAVVFFKGCPLRCPFCHNPAIQAFDGTSNMDWDKEVLPFLESRRRRLDGVVLSGGEPLGQPELLTAVQDLKKRGFQVALHTSGVYPERLRQVAPLLDWVGLDVKAPWDKYALLTAREHVAPLIQESLEILKESAVPFEARTTCDPRFLSPEDIRKIADELMCRGVSTYALQKYRTFPEDENPPSLSDIECFFEDKALLADLKNSFSSFICRG